MNEEIEGLITTTLSAMSNQQDVEKNRDAKKRSTSYYAQNGNKRYAITITDKCIEDHSVTSIEGRLVNAALAFQKTPNIEFKLLSDKDEINVLKN